MGPKKYVKNSKWVSRVWPSVCVCVCVCLYMLVQVGICERRCVWMRVNKNKKQQQKKKKQNKKRISRLRKKAEFFVRTLWTNGQDKQQLNPKINFSLHAINKVHLENTSDPFPATRFLHLNFPICRNFAHILQSRIISLKCIIMSSDSVSSLPPKLSRSLAKG